jgi:nucleoside-diphosphate-sugar epimerase
MKIFVAGASGAIGRRLVPLLVAGGHEVAAMTHSHERAALLDGLGARPVIADGLDRDGVIQAVTRVAPEVVVHEMTSLARATNLRRFDNVFALTNRLRTEGTDHLLAAARLAGTRRFVAQSFGNWNYESAGGSVKSEDDPLERHPPRSMRHSLAAIDHLESAVLGAQGLEGIAFRYGNLYGPGTAIAPDGEIVKALRRRRLPIIGAGEGVWSFVHVDDAAAATLAAIERGAPGVYNVSDDAPATVVAWLPQLARIVRAEPPRHVPAWVGQLVAGEAVVRMFTSIRGASNAKAKRELGWRLQYPNWSQGFVSGLADPESYRPPVARPALAPWRRAPRRAGA